MHILTAILMTLQRNWLRARGSGFGVWQVSVIVHKGWDPYCLVKPLGTERSFFWDKVAGANYVATSLTMCGVLSPLLYASWRIGTNVNSRHTRIAGSLIMSHCMRWFYWTAVRKVLFTKKKLVQKNK